MAAAAACGSLKHHCIFDKKKPTSLNPTFLDFSSSSSSSSSWPHIHPIQTLKNLPSFDPQELPHHQHHCCCHHDPLLESDQNHHKLDENSANYGQRRQHGRSDSFSSMSSESLSMCTEGLGFESCDDMEEDFGKNELHSENESNDSIKEPCEELLCKRSMVAPSASLRSFPPPISCIGRNGKPWVCFKSFRENGRFILKEIRIPNQEILHSYRENGRFRLQFAGSDDDDILEEGGEEEEDDEEKNKKQETVDNGERNET